MNIDVQAILLGVVKAVAAGAIIGGGTIVLQTQRNDAVQDREIVTIRQEQERVLSSMGTLKGSVDKANENFAELNGYIKGLNVHKENPRN